MSISRRAKAALIMTGVVLISLAAGFVLGAATAKKIGKKKDDPAFWKPAAMKHLETLKPTDSQRDRFQAILNKAATELADIRADTVTRADAILAKALADVDQELTPDQREKFAKIKPKKSTVAPNK